MRINVAGIREKLSLKFEPKWFELVRRHERRHAIKRLHKVAPTYVGVTGSCGKSSTTRLLGQVLAKGYSQVTQIGYANNQERYAYRSLRKMPANCETVVQELHGGAPGYLDYLVEHIPLNVAILTSIGTDHAKAFDNAQDIAKEKSKIVDALLPGGVACLNIDSEPVEAIAGTIRPDVRCITVSAKKAADVSAEVIHADWKRRLRFNLKLDGTVVDVQTRFVGTIGLTNILLVIAAVHGMGLDIAPALKVISEYEPSDNRMNIRQAANGRYFLLDAFKASLWSSKMLADDLVNIRSGPIVAVVGQLSETGSSGSVRYRQFIRRLEPHCDAIIGTSGALSSARKRQHSDPESNIVGCETIDDILVELEKYPNALVLLKSASVAKLWRVYAASNEPISCKLTHCRMVSNCQNCSMLRA